MLTRRRFGAAALAGTAAAAAPLAARASGDGRFALAPDVAARWATHRSEPGPSLVQLADGVRLRSGPMGAVDREGLATWSRESWEGDFRLDFATTKRDANAGAGDQALFLLLYFGARGDGTPGHPERLADWPASTVPYTHAYADHVRGARITLYLQPPGAAGEARALSAAYFKADGSRNAVQPSTTELFPGVRDVPYRWTVSRAGGAVTVTQHEGEAARTATFANPALAEFAGAGSFGLLVAPGRDAEVSDFAVSRP